MAFLESRRNGTTLELTLHGVWRAADVDSILAEIQALECDGAVEAKIGTAGVERLDVAGAWALDDLTRILAGRGVAVSFVEGEPSILLLVRRALHAEQKDKPPALRGEVNFNIVERLGRTAIKRLWGVRHGLDFLGRATMTFLRACTSWRGCGPPRSRGTSTTPASPPSRSSR